MFLKNKLLNRPVLPVDMLVFDDEMVSIIYHKQPQHFLLSRIIGGSIIGQVNSGAQFQLCYDLNALPGIREMLLGFVCSLTHFWLVLVCDSSFLNLTDQVLCC